MQIEQFDTGLKTKTNVENIVLSPEKNLQNKNLIRGYLNKIITSGVSEINKNLEEAFITDVKINSFYPINEFEGLKNLKEKIFIPLFEAFPDLERRENIVVGGAFRDKVLVGSYSVLSGYFEYCYWNTFRNLLCKTSKILFNDKTNNGLYANNACICIYDSSHRIFWNRESCSSNYYNDFWRNTCCKTNSIRFKRST